MQRNYLIVGIVLAALIGVAAYFALSSGPDSNVSSPTDASIAKSDAEHRPRTGELETARAAASNASGTATRSAANADPKNEPAVAADAVAEIRGRVVTGESNLPVPNARIWVEEGGIFGRVFMGRDYREPEPSAIAGNDGQFRVAGVETGRDLRLRIEAPGRIRLRTEVQPIAKKERRALGDLALAMAAQAEGRVTDPAGVPIANATVLARRAGNPADGLMAFRAPLDIESKTDASGRYRLDGLPPGQSIQFSAFADSYIANTTDPFEARVGSPKQVADIILKPGKDVTGRVLDQDGKPVAAANIDIWRSFGSGDFFVDGRASSNFKTDAEGSFRITGLDDRTITMNVMAPGKGTATKRNITPGTRDLIVQLENLGIIRGRIVPAPGIDPRQVASSFAQLQLEAKRVDRPGFIMLAGDEDEGSRVREDGSFELSGLEKGKYHVEVSGDTIVPAVSEAVDVSPDRPVENVVIAVSTGNTLVVHVQKKAGDEPVADATVRITEKREGSPKFAMPGLAGDDEEEESNIAIGPTGAAPARVRATRAVSTNVSLRGTRAGGGPRRPMARQFLGDPEKPNEPAPISRTLKTDAAGNARFQGLPNAKFDVTARKADLAPSMPVEVVFDTAEGAPRNQQVVMTEGGALTGLVTRPNGLLAIGQTVEITGPEPLTKVKRAVTDEKGNYLFEHLRPGTYRAKLKKNDGNADGVRFYTQASDADLSVYGQPVVVTDGKETVFHLEAPLLVTVSGVVTQAGAPVAGVKVTLSAAEDGMPDFGMDMFGAGAGFSATTDGAGKYKIENVEGGQYKVSAKKPTSVKASTRIVKLSSEKETVDVQLPRGVIEGRVFRSEGHAPLANATLQAIEGGGGGTREVMAIGISMSSASGGGGEVMTFDGRGSVRSDAEGRFKIEDLPAGKYKIKATFAGLRDATTEVLTLDEDGRVSDVEVVLEKAATVRGRVTGPGGAARGGALVSLAKKGGGQPKLTVADENGAYKFTSLDPGDYFLSAQQMGGPITLGADENKGVSVQLEAGTETTKDLQLDQ